MAVISNNFAISHWKKLLYREGWGNQQPTLPGTALATPTARLRPGLRAGASNTKAVPLRSEPGKAVRSPQGLIKPPKNAFGSPARITLGPGPRTAASCRRQLRRDGVCVTAEEQVCTRYPPGQTPLYPRVWPLGKKIGRCGPRGRGAGGRREAEQVKNAGQEGRHRFRGQGQGQRTVMQRRGPQGTGAGLVLTHGTRQFPGAFPCRPGPEPCDAVVGARGPPQHTCWLISGFSAPLSPGGEDKDALSFSLSSDG